MPRTPSPEWCANRRNIRRANEDISRVRRDIDNLSNQLSSERTCRLSVEQRVSVLSSELSNEQDAKRAIEQRLANEQSARELVEQTIITDKAHIESKYNELDQHSQQSYAELSAKYTQLSERLNELYNELRSNITEKFLSLEAQLLKLNELYNEFRSNITNVESHSESNHAEITEKFLSLEAQLLNSNPHHQDEALPYEPQGQAPVIIPAGEIENGFEQLHEVPEFMRLEPKADQNLDLMVMKSISDLVKKGNNRINEPAEKAILLLGKTGAGKSTLAHILSGNSVSAVKHNKRLVIKEEEELENVKISHQPSSETTIPARCENTNFTIWDCPGFDDTKGIDQEIANSFYIKKLFAMNKSLKFLLVVTESSITDERGIHFVDTVNHFIRLFKDIGRVQDSVSLVVTKCEAGIEAEDIEQEIQQLISSREVNHKYTKHTDSLIKHSLINNIQIVHKPTNIGPLLISDDFISEIADDKYMDVSPDMANVTISDESQEYARVLLDSAGEFFKEITNVIVSSICEVKKSINTDFVKFQDSYSMVQNLILEGIARHSFDRFDAHWTDGEYFTNLDAISGVANKLSESKHFNDFEGLVSIMQTLIDTLEEFCKPENLEIKEMLQDYRYAIKQQYDYMQVFSQICKVDAPDYAQELNSILDRCSRTVENALKHEVKSINLAKSHHDPEYYLQAVKYFKLYRGEPECAKKEADSYKYLGDIYKFAGNVDDALNCYKQAILINKEMPEAYIEIGNILFNAGRYEEAIKIYKPVNYSLKIKECYNKLLDLTPGNPELMIEAADYFASIGVSQRANELYNDAYSLSNDAAIKTDAMCKIANTLRNSYALANTFAEKAANQQFYDFDSISLDEINQLVIGEIVILGETGQNQP